MMSISPAPGDEQVIMGFSLANIRTARLAMLANMQPRALFDNTFVSTVMAAVLLMLSVMSFSSRRKLRLLVTATRRIETAGLRKTGARLL